MSPESDKKYNLLKGTVSRDWNGSYMARMDIRMSQICFISNVWKVKNCAPFWLCNAKNRSVSQVEGSLGQYTFLKNTIKNKTKNTGIKFFLLIQNS